MAHEEVELGVCCQEEIRKEVEAGKERRLAELLPMPLGLHGLKGHKRRGEV